MFPTIYMNNGGGNVVYEYYTSNTYPVLFSDDITSNVFFVGGTFFELQTENVSSNVVVVSGEVRNQLQTYTNYPVENVTTSNVEIVSGNVQTLLITYSNYPTENVTSNVFIVSGSVA